MVGHILLSNNVIAARNVDHTYHAMELASLVSLRTTPEVLALPCTELAEVLCCFRGDVREQLHLYATQWFTCDCRD